MLKHYLKIAIRNLLKYKQQSLISIIGLAVGVTCFAFCSYTLRTSMAWERSITDIDRICILYSETEQGSEICYEHYAPYALAKAFPEIESAIAYSNIGPYTDKLCEITAADGTVSYFNEVFLFSEPGFLDFFDIRLINGNEKNIQQIPNAILVTEKTAYKLFGTLDVVGKTFTNIDDFNDQKEVFTIQGVIEDFPVQSSLERYSGIELNTTNPAIADPESSMHYNGYSSYVKIKPGINLSQLNKKLANYNLEYLRGKDAIAELKVQLKPLTLRRELFLKGKFDSAELIFFAIGALVLLTALFNYVIFIIGRMMNRIRECGIRQVNGAEKWSLFTLLFTEAAIAFIVACFLSFIITELITPYISNIQLYYTLNRSFIFKLLIQYSFVGLILIALLCLGVIGKIGKFSIIESLFNDKTIRRHSILRHLFISIQLVICFLFLGMTWFVLQQSKLLESRLTAGLSEADKTTLFEVSLNGDKFVPIRQDMLRKFEQNPKIKTVCRNAMGLSGAWQLGEGRFSWDGITEQEAKTTLSHVYTDPSYFDLINQKPIKGRLYKPEETDKAIINESLARLLNRDPIGMQISVRYWGKEMTSYQIVGILPDAISNLNDWNSSQSVLPCIYMPFPENSVNMSCLVKVSPEYRKDFPAEVKAELYKYVNQATPIYINSMKEQAGFYLNYEQNLFRLISILSIVCILISLLGIYASVTLSTERRKKEVAIRKINGATPQTILFMFCKSSILQLFISAAIAFPLLIMILTSWLQHYTVRIPIGVIPFIILFILMVIVVAVTIIWQLKRIANLNPAEIIKTE